MTNLIIFARREDLGQQGQFPTYAHLTAPSLWRGVIFASNWVDETDVLGIGNVHTVTLLVVHLEK